MSNKTIPMETDEFLDEFKEFKWFIELETEKGKNSEVGKSICISLIKYRDGYVDPIGECFVSVSYEEDGCDHDVSYQKISNELFEQIMGITTPDELPHPNAKPPHDPPNVTHAKKRVVEKVFVNHVYT